MNPGGIVVLIAGVWLGCQVFGGDMLQRLGVISTGAATPITYPGASGSVTPTAGAAGSSSRVLNV